jgi:hypothetical protein
MLPPPIISRYTSAVNDPVPDARPDAMRVKLFEKKVMK